MSEKRRGMPEVEEILRSWKGDNVSVLLDLRVFPRATSPDVTEAIKFHLRYVTDEMKTIVTALVGSLALCSCRNKVEQTKPQESFLATVEVLSAGAMHDNFGDQAHQRSLVVNYKIVTPADLAGREFTMFYAMPEGTNNAPPIGAIVKMEVDKAFLDAQAKQ
jgi:hypothetical protein